MSAIDVTVGIGNGISRAYDLPVVDWDFLTVYVGGVEVFRGPDYDTIPGSTAWWTDMLVFRIPPANGARISMDAIGGDYVNFLTGAGIASITDEPFLTVEVE